MALIAPLMPGTHKAHAQAAQLPANQAYFMLVNGNSGSCVDLIDGSTADQAVVNQYSYDSGSSAQRWALVPASGHFEIISWVTGKALTVSGDATTSGAQIVDVTYKSDPSQQWDLVDQGSGWFSIKNVRSGLALDIANSSTADNAMLRQEASTGGTNQLFRLQPWGDYFIKSVNSSRYLTVENQATANSNPIVQYDKGSMAGFHWVFNDEGSGYYSVSDTNSPTRVISVDNTSTTAGAGTQLYDYNPDNAGDQEVRVLPKTDGNYKFYFKFDGQSWNFPSAKTTNNVVLQQYTDDISKSQEFALERDTSNSVPGFVTNSVYSIPASAVPAPTGSGVVSLRLVNGTGGSYRSSKLYWGILGQDPANNNQWSYVDATGNLHPISAALNNAPGHLTKNGTNYANIYTTFDKTGWVNLPKITSARLYLSCGSPCYITTYDSGFAGPNIDNPTDPNDDVVFDFTEFTIDSGGYHGNITRVDGFGFPIQHRLVDLAGSYDQTVGELEAKTRSALFSEYQSEVPSAFQSLATVQVPYRIVAPIHGSFASGQPNGSYFSSTGFNTQDVLLGINTASNPNTCAALNRGVYSQPQSSWSNPALYYQTSPANYYAQFWHAHGISSLAYGFCYDDVNGQAAYLSLANPKGLIIRIGR